MIYAECPNRWIRVSRLVFFSLLSLSLLACGHSTEKFLARGEEFLQKRKFHDAMMQFRAAAESDKDSAKAHWGLARAYENLGRFNETLDELRKTVELDNTNLDAKARLGNYFLLVQPPLVSEAEKVQEEIAAADPKFVEGQILKASILSTRERPESEVVAAIDQAIAIDPNRTETYLSLSRYYISHDQNDQAEAAIKKGIAVNSNAPLGMIEYGRFLAYANRNDEAEKEFGQAIAIDPSNIEAHEAIADFFTSTQQFDKAEASYKQLVDIQENSPESRLELADFYNAAGRQPEAITTLEQIVTDTPEYAEARYRLGQIYLDRKESEKVNEQVDYLLKVNAGDAEALMLRARVKMLENKSDDAVKDLEEVLKQQPSERDALFYISQAKLALGEIDQAKAFMADLERYHPSFLKSGLLRIEAAFTVGDSNDALKQASDLLARVNSSTPNAETDAKELRDLGARALTARGMAYLDLGRIPEAKADLTAVAQGSPNSATPMVNLAKVYLAEKNANGALDLYEKAFALDNTNFDALSGVVSVSMTLNQSQQALAKIDAAIDQNAGRGDVLSALHYLRSTVFQTGGDSASAENELQQSIALDANYLPSYSAYASLLVARSETAAAIDQYHKVVELSPSAPVYTLLGILEDSRGNATDSEANYRKALEIKPDSPIAANNLAWLIVDNQGNLDEALQLATYSVSRNQTVAGFYDTLGWVYYKKGLYAPAVEQFRKAVALNEKSDKNSNPGYRVRLGMALASSGDKTSARREVETSLQFQNELSQKEISDAKNVLARL